MYHVVLATMLFAGGEATTWHHCHGCSGCYGCHGCHGYAYPGYCSGCSGCYCSGCSGCWGCHGGYSFYSSCSCSCWGCYGCSGCHGCWGCYGCSCSCSGNSLYSAGCFGCSGYGVVVATPYCYGCSGCSGYYGCCGGVITTPSVVTSPSVLTVPPTQSNTTVDPSVVPQTDAERDAIRQYLKGLRERKDDRKQPFIPPVPTPGEVSTAKVTVTVPADARLWVDQVECPLTSSVRSFDTPALKAGQTYAYTLRAQVERNGERVMDSQRVVLRAGQHVNVSFPNLNSLSTAAR